MADSDAERDRDQPGEQPKELFPPTYAPIDLSKPPAPSGVPGPPPPTSGRAGLVVGALLLAVVVLVVAAGVVAWRLLAGHPSDGTGRPAAAPTPTTAGRPSAPRAPSTPPTTAAPSAGPWVTVTSKKDGMAYDVPPNWTASPDALAGYESSTGQIQALAHGVASSSDGWCGSGSDHTLVGFVTPGSISDGGTVADTATKWASAGGEDDHGTKPTGTVAAPRPVKVAGGRVTASEATATYRPVAQKCAAPLLEVTAVSVPKPAGGTALFVLVADRDMDGVDSDATLAKVVASLRPVG